MTEANLRLSAEADARNAEQQFASMEQRAMGLEANNTDLKNELEDQKQQLTKLYRAEEKAADLYEGMRTMCEKNADLASKLRVANQREEGLRNELGVVSNALGIERKNAQYANETAMALEGQLKSSVAHLVPGSAAIGVLMTHLEVTLEAIEGKLARTAYRARGLYDGWKDIVRCVGMAR